MASKHLLRIGGIDRQFMLARVNAGVGEWAGKPSLATAAVNIDFGVALRGGFLKSDASLHVIDALMLLLRLLSWPPVTTAQLQRASDTFGCDPFGNERRLRDHLQSLCAAGNVRYWTTAQAGGGLQNYYKLTPLGYAMVCGTEPEQPTRTFFAEVSPKAGDRQVQPDCFFRLASSGRSFNLVFEIDNSTASIDAHAINSIWQKLTTAKHIKNGWYPNGTRAESNWNGPASASSSSHARSITSTISSSTQPRPMPTSAAA